MQFIIDNFNERVKEVEKYYSILSLLYDERVQIKRKTKNRQLSISLDKDALKIMKSTCFLLLYNLIESSVRESFSYLYDKINSDSKDISSFTDYFKEIWIDQGFSNIDNLTSNANTYREITKKLIYETMRKEILNLDSEKLPISGNLDARKIRELFEMHDIKLKVHKNAFGGAELKTVKDKRNELAHGNISFSECGKEYSIDSLVSIKKQTVLYLRATLRCLRKFSKAKAYEI